ncbi:MAG: P-II family nitrogen regulator [Nitrososphaerales archaeon]|jgi:nitrogen regulatory protein PII|nr:P-II family nitrogen regulator [Nitrososphaerales archaeon]|tara:strand:+ start:178 stop:516 length:339 start_codon:yes stop_codon:yes gene_type:complete
MKKIEAIIRGEKLNEVRKALLEADIPGITVYEVRGKGNQKGLELQFRGRPYNVDLLPKTKIELMVSDKNSEKVVELIKETAHTGNVGDGKIMILPMDDLIKIRTGESGDYAI